AAAKHDSVHSMITRVSINRCNEFVRGQVERAKRLVSHVTREKLNVRRLLAVRTGIQILATPDRPDQRLPRVWIDESSQLVDYSGHHRIVFGSRFDYAVGVATSKVDEYLAVVPFRERHCPRPIDITERQHHRVCEL